MTGSSIDWIRVLVSLLFLGYASWSDLRSREVNDFVWVVFAPAGFLLTVLSIYLARDWALLAVFGVYAGFMIVLSVALFYFGVFFAEADAKALICLSLAMPWYPVATPVHPLVSFVQPLLPLSALANGVLVEAGSIFYLLSRNIVWKFRTGGKLFGGFENIPLWKKLILLLIGYKVKIPEAEKKIYLYPLEDIKVKGRTAVPVLQIFVTHKEDRDMLVRKLKQYARGRELSRRIWVTLGLPLIVFITIGFVLALLFGDIIFWIIFQVLGRW